MRVGVTQVTPLESKVTELPLIQWDRVVVFLMVVLLVCVQRTITLINHLRVLDWESFGFS